MSKKRDRRGRGPDNGGDGKPPRRPAELRGETLEDRILLSATWVDADTGDAIDGPTDGADVYLGSVDADVASGGLGSDSLFGDAGDDVLHGGGNDDTVSGGDGNDTLTGSWGNDTLVGGEGNDHLDGGTDHDTLDGGAGNDTLIGDSGNDTLTGGAGNDDLDGGTDDDVIDGGDGDDTIVGGSGRDRLSGGAGNDTITDSDGEDVIDGGDGDDTIDAGHQDDIITGGAGHDTIDGGTGSDTIDGGTGNDTIFGGHQDDIIDGGDGDDVIDGGTGHDRITGGAGADRMTGDYGDDLFIADGDDIIDGGGDSDTVDYSSSGAGVVVDLTGAGDGPSVVNVETVIGSDHGDTFTFGSPTAWTTYGIRAGAGGATLDLSGFTYDDLTFNDGSITVDMGNWQTFTIEYDGPTDIVVGSGAEAFTVQLPDAIVAEESTAVTISATAVRSADATLTYRWTQTAGPSVALAGADSPAMTFHAPELDAGTVMEFRLEVSDGDTTVTETVTVGISADNDPVVIDLGGDRVVAERSSVTVDASVVDPEGKDFVYEWRQVSGPTIDLVDTDTLSPSFVAPELLSNEDIVLELTATDGQTTVSEQVTFTVAAVNDAATADAGDADSVEENEVYTLRGSGDDPEGQSLTYSWRQVSGPTVVLDDPTSAEPSFTAPEGLANTTVSFELTVSDGVNESTDTVAITINADNDAPTTTQPPVFRGHEGGTISMAIEASDIEGESLTYNWIQRGGPAVTLTGGDTATPSFEAPELVVNSWVRFEVEVSDGTNTVVDTVWAFIDADNLAPTVEAMDDFYGTEDEVVMLSAAGADPEGRAIAYEWTQVSGPETTIYGAGGSSPQVRLPGVDEPTTVTFQVRVTDGEHSTIDTVDVLVYPGEETDGGSGPGNSGGAGNSGSAPGGGGGGGSGGGGGGGGGGDPVPLLIETPAIIEVIEEGGVAITSSVDSSNGGITYSWRQVDGSRDVTLTDADTGSPSFTTPNLPRSEIFVFEMTATDGTHTVTQTVNVLIEADNDAPTIDGDTTVVAEEDGEVAFGIPASDPEGMELHYAWAQVGGPEVELLDADTGSPRFIAPNTLETTEYTFEVTLNDGESEVTELVTVRVEADNDAPTLSLGDDREVNEGDEVTLTSVATDPEGQGLTYQWRQTGGPTVTLSDPTAGSPSFTAPNLLNDTDLSFELVVSDGVNETVESITITVLADNDPPEVDAGPLLEVDEGDLVNLSAAINDPEGRDVTISWRQIGGAEVTLTGADTPTPSFTAPNNLTNSFLRFEVTVSDGVHEVTDTVRVLVNADNDAPLIDAGSPVAAIERTEVTLSASAVDPEGRTLLHSWEQVSGPSVALSNTDGLSPTFTAPDVNQPTVLVFQLTTTDGENTVVDTVAVTVDGENDGPIATDGRDTGTEDHTVAVRLGGTDQDYADAVESFRIDSLPSHGELRVNGVAIVPGTVVTKADVDAGLLTFEPDQDWSGTDTFTFSVGDGDAWSDAAGEHDIRVYGRADSPFVDAGSAAKDEDMFVDLDFSFATADIDGSETISRVTVQGAPIGSTITDGVHTTIVTGTGKVDITSYDTSTLQILPPPDHETDFTLTLRVTAREPDSGHQTTAADTVLVVINPVDDAPRPHDTVITTTEDTAIVVRPSADQVDQDDPIEAYRIDTLPANGRLLLNGAEVTAGTEFTAAERAAGALVFEPAEDWDGEVSFTFSASDGENWSDTSGTVTLRVTAVADDALLTTGDVTGSEDTAIALPFAAAVADADDSESISTIRVGGVPAGSVLSDGVNTVTADGSAITITGWDTANLTVTPPANRDTGFDVTFEVTTRESSNDDEATVSETVTVHVTPVNDRTVALSGSATTQEDTPVVVTLRGVDVEDGSNITSFRIDALPANGTLRFDGQAVASGEVIPGDAVASGRLTFDPAENWSGTTTIAFSASDGDLWSTNPATFSITVDAVADAAAVTAPGASGAEDTAIAINLSASVIDSSETIDSIVIAGVPTGATLSAGTDNGDGTWTLAAGDLPGLTITPPTNSSADFDLSYTVTTRDGASTQQTTGTFGVTVNAVADTAAVTASDVAGLEDTAIAINLSAAITDGSETIDSVVISGVPTGATLSAGTDNGDGTWTLAAADLPGLSVTPPDDFSGAFDLDYAVTTRDGDSTRDTTGSFTVTVDAVADEVALSAADITGNEDTAIPLGLSAAVTDDSETIDSIVISGVPTGATLSAGTDNGDGTWTLAAGDLPGLTITPPANSDADFDLGYTVNSSDADAARATTGAIRVTVDAVADAAATTASDATGSEDSAIALNLTAAVTDDSETIESIVISGVPTGAIMSAGTDNGDGTWTLTTADLPGLTITPAEDFSGDIDLEYTVTTRDGDSTEQTARSFTVSVSAAADEIAVTASDSTGDEDTPIALGLSAAVTDDSETIDSIVLSGVPTGANLSAGTDNGDGTWTLAATDLPGLTITPPDDFSGDFEVQYTITSRDGDSARETTGSLTVTVDAVADEIAVSAPGATTNEDTAVAIDLSAAVTDDSESIDSIVIAGVPTGAILSAGTDNGDGSWTLAATDLPGLTITPPDDFSGDFELQYTISSRDADATRDSTGSFTVSVTAVADNAAVTAANTTGTEDTPVAIDLSTAVTDESETIDSIVIAGVPTGATLSAGTDNGDGTWTLAATDLPGLTVTPPSNFSGEFELSYTVTTRDGDSTQDTNGSFSISVQAVADAAAVTASDATGFEDTAIAINLSAAVTDDSESIESIVIAGVPTGATLSAGTDNGDGTWTLSTADLPGLTITPPQDADEDFDLSYTVTTRDGDSTRDTTGSFTVTVIATPEAAELKATEVETDPDDPWADISELAILNAQAEVDDMVELADDAAAPGIDLDTPANVIEPLVAGEQVIESEIVARIDEPAIAPAADPDIDPDFERPAFEVFVSTDDTTSRRASADEATQDDARNAFGDRVSEAARTAATGGDPARSGVFPVLWGMLRGLGIGPRTEQRDDENRVNRRRG